MDFFNESQVPNVKKSFLKFTACGIVGRDRRVTDYGVRGLGFKSPGSIQTSRT